MLRLISAVTLISLLAVFSSESNRWQINAGESLSLTTQDTHAVGNDLTGADPEDVDALVFDNDILALLCVSYAFYYWFDVTLARHFVKQTIRGPPLTS